MNLFTGKLKIKSIETVARETKKFIFSVHSLVKLDGTPAKEEILPFQAGQFVSVEFKDKLARAYSIASTPSEKNIELIIRIVAGGSGSTILDAAKVGDEFKFKGPFGHFVLSDNKNANLIFCGTGTGIAPLRSMILMENKMVPPRKMKLFYGGRDQADIAYLEELETWNKDLKIRLGLSREEDKTKLGKYGEPCRITKFIEENDFDNNSEFYICGNGAMVKSTVEILSEKGVEKSRIFMERFN